MTASDGMDTNISVLLLGEKQSGKSSVGNSILRKTAFHKNTKRSSREDVTIMGEQIFQVTVVDTPGWFSHTSTPDKVSKEIRRGFTLCHPGPSAILLVLPTTATFSQREWKAMEVQLTQLQTTIWTRAIVLFTHGDLLGVVSIQEHIQQQGRTLHWLLERCGNRHHVMNNQPEASHTEANQLLQKIKNMMQINLLSWEQRNILYTRLRQDVFHMEEEEEEEERQRVQQRRDIKKYHVFHDDRPRLKQQVSAAGPSRTLAFILLGRRKSGKSSAGNIILNRKEFKVHQYQRTSRCSVGQGPVLGCDVTVVDTPGWSQFSLTEGKKVEAEIRRSTSLCPEGSKVTFLLVLPVDMFRKKDRRVLEESVSTLGDSVWRRSVVLFTFGEQLRGTTVEQHIMENGEPLQEVLEKCGHRHVVFSTDTGDMDQVKQLIAVVEQMQTAVIATWRSYVS